MLLRHPTSFIKFVIIQGNTNKCTVLKYKVFTTKALQLRHVTTFVGHPQGEYINICIKRSYK
jgi:hypothetical protein